MTRTTDDLQEKEPWRPFGEKVTRTTPQLPDWKQIPGAQKGVGIGSDGKVSTRIPTNSL